MALLLNVPYNNSMDRTNVTDKGYSYNGQDFTYQNKVDSQGQNYQVAVPITISSSTLSSPQATIPVTQPTYNTGAQQTQAAQAGVYTGNTYNDAQAKADAQLKAQQDAYTSANSDLARLQASMGGKGTDLVTAYNTQDAAGNSVNSLAGKLRALSAQSQALGLDTQAKTQAEINKATGQNITQSAVNRNTADATRENLINQASIAMQSAIVNADYQTAKSYADQIVEAKYDQKLADIEAAKTNIQNAQFTFTQAEKKLAEATTARLNKEKQDYEKKIVDEKQVNDLIITASPVAPSDVLTRAKAIQAKGGSATEVAMALGVYGGDYLKNQLLKEQLKTEVSQRSKIASDIAVNNAQIRNYDASANKSNAESTGTTAKPLTDVQAKDLLYAQRGEQANSIIDNLQKTVVGMSPTSFATQKALESSSLTSGQVSNEIRQLRQAERNFATAILRKESGAAISPTEFATVEKQYFPRPGDDIQTLAQKKMNRETYISGTKSGVPGYDKRVTTPESSYLDSVDASLKVVEQKTTPVSLYTSRLLGLPGVK